MEPLRLLADDPIPVLTPALRQVVGDGLPLPELGIHEPVDQLSDLPFDLLRGIANNLRLEPLLHAAAVQQIHDASDPQGVVEVVLPAAFHLEQDLVDVRHPVLEVARQVVLIDLQLPFDFAQRREVLGQQRQPLADDDAVTLGSNLVRTWAFNDGAEQWNALQTAPGAGYKLVVE